jgi:hypothetical protein
MQINRFEDVLGVIPTEDIVEGRFVLLTEQSFSYDFGSREDVVGVKLPDTADEATRCKFCITWAVTNVPAPMMLVPPALDQGARRGGWSETANTPITGQTIYLTYPGYTEGATIPSGLPSLVYTEGTFTIPLGGYVADADIIKPGAGIKIADTDSDSAGDAGKPKYCATNAVGMIGYTERYDSTTGALTIRVE